MLRRAFVAVAFVCLPAFGSQSLGSGTGTTRLPNSAPFAEVATWRAELRIHDFTFDQGYQTVFGTSAYTLRLAPGKAVSLTSWKDASLSCFVILGDRTDVIVRFQRDAASRRLTVEAWNAADGGQYVQAVCPISNPGNPKDGGASAELGGFKGALAYLRLYRTVVPLRSAPSNTYNGDMLDYEFEGDGKDLANNAKLSLSSAKYVDTPSYSPAAIFGQYPASRTFIAGKTSIAVDASGSFTATENASLTYAWAQISGPSEGWFGDPAVAVTNFTASVPGTYLLQLTVSDNLGNTGTYQAKYGGVTTGDDGLVIVDDPAMSAVLGPLAPWGTSPWPWFDLTERADADALIPYQTKYPDEGTPLTGTVTVQVANGNPYAPPVVVGNGTQFTTELKRGDGVAFHWNALDGLTGNWVAVVSAITDDTHLTLDRVGNPHPFPFNDIAASKVDPGQFNSWGVNQSVSTNWNFYDNVLALYRLYYRTGIDDYQTAARTLADGWYHYGLDHGYNILYPRYASLQGLFARALDGRPEYWNGLLFQMNYPIGWTAQFRQTSPLPPNSEIEPRETGYMLRWAALLAKIHPDPAIRAQWCTAVANSVTNVWPSVQDDLGNFEEDVYNGNPGYPYKAYDGRYGSSPWRATLALLGLEQAYDVLSDPSLCNNADAAGTALGVATKFADFVHDYGTGKGRGQLYSVGYETSAQNPVAAAGFNQTSPNTTGTLTVTQGSSTIVGEGTNFTAVFSGVTGADRAAPAAVHGNRIDQPVRYIGIPAGGGCNLVFEVTSVESDTELTIKEPWPARCKSASKITSVLGWVATWEAQKNCGSRAVYCEGGPDGDRNLTHDIHAAYMWAWEKTKDRKYLDWAGDSLGADYGGPAGGPGTVGSGEGPLADGKTGNFADPLPVCGTPPCGGLGTVNSMGKALGMSAGAGNAPNAIALYSVEMGVQMPMGNQPAAPPRNPETGTPNRPKR